MSKRSNTRHFVKGFAIASASAIMLSGCAAFKKSDPIEVGSVPDDYRTRHAIVIAEKERVFEVPVGTQHTKLTKGMQSVTRSFLSGYKDSGTGIVRIIAPVGSANQSAASSVASRVAGLAKQVGVPANKISHENYYPAADQAAPVRIMYKAIAAQTSQCGRWSEDVLHTSENKQYKNFGCSIQSNLAAQVADPADLLGPRELGEVDTANRDSVIETYRGETGTFESSIDY